MDGAFKPLSQVAYDASVAVDETRREMSTRFEQTDAAIALKADQTEVNSLSTRVQSAEQKITPQAITATVAASALYAFDKYEGRNYCLESGGRISFLPTTAITMKMEAQPIWFKRHCPCRMIFLLIANGGSAIRISLDIQRQNVDASGSHDARHLLRVLGVLPSTWMRAC